MSSTTPLTPKDFFLWLGAMASLYGSTVALIALLFHYINYLYPDALARADYYYDPYSAGIRFAIAALFVLLPLYLALTRMLGKDMRAHPEKRELGFRRWLIYVTLFVAGVTMVIDLITLVNTFLEGEITTRFILKVLTVFVIAGGVFAYYLSDLRGRWIANPRASAIIGALVGVLVLLTIGAGFFIIGSPQTARELRFDEERVRDLQNMQWQIVNYWQNKGALPERLAQLEDSISGFVVPSDPATHANYEYRVIDDLSFELCATFARATPEHAGLKEPFMEETWEHGTGVHCFARTIDPDRYAPKEVQTGETTRPLPAQGEFPY